MPDDCDTGNQLLFLLSILTAAAFVGYLAFVENEAIWWAVLAFAVLVLADIYVGVTLNHDR